ncbi:MAG: 2-keto-4-pentenoate hydratase/2-oxohepta-3-ene,7-dioic acid hydratase [Polaromonas sp.]|nr:2-keto-4-pentenoate hydratase/2-oxohepta-3-ene,7-dioic acid hydratase [Polaromonas sp.]
MKLVRFFVAGDAEGSSRVGLLDGDKLAHISARALGLGPEADVWGSDMTALVRAGDKAQSALREGSARLFADAGSVFALDQVKLLAPMMPSTILCSGSNYHAHNREKASSPLSGKEPEFFIKTSDCVIGPGDGIVHDEVLTKKLDSETELAIIIGKAGRHIPVAQALDHVFGYSIVNDVTARDRQVRRKPDGSTWYELGRGKVFDTSAPFGPCIVTADEIGDPQRLHIRTRINGELRQSGSTEDMIWSCAELVHFFSINLTLRPGMVIITGTPAGTAWSSDRELGGNWMPPEDGEKLVAAKGYNQPGDTVESSIEGIGVLRNTVITLRGQAVGG